MKREAKFGLLFRHWLKANPRLSGAFELKQTTRNSLPFNAVAEHQLEALRAVNNDGLLYKAPDDSIGQKPFDYFYLRNAPAYVVVKFPKFFVAITIETFILEKSRSKRKSLLSGRAKDIASFVVELSPVRD